MSQTSSPSGPAALPERPADPGHALKKVDSLSFSRLPSSASPTIEPPTGSPPSSSARSSTSAGSSPSPKGSFDRRRRAFKKKISRRKHSSSDVTPPIELIQHSGDEHAEAGSSTAQSARHDAAAPSVALASQAAAASRPQQPDRRPELAYDVLVEHQRGFTLFGKPRYSSNSLLPLDPKPWVNAATGQPSPVDVSDFGAPVGWEWSWDQWCVDMGTYVADATPDSGIGTFVVVEGDVDRNGWQYAGWFGIARFLGWLARVRARSSRAKARRSGGADGRPDSGDGPVDEAATAVSTTTTATTSPTTATTTTTTSNRPPNHTNVFSGWHGTNRFFFSSFVRRRWWIRQRVRVCLPGQLREGTGGVPPQLRWPTDFPTGDGHLLFKEAAQDIFGGPCNLVGTEQKVPEPASATGPDRDPRDGGMSKHAELVQDLQRARDDRERLEKLSRFLDGHLLSPIPLDTSNKGKARKPSEFVPGSGSGSSSSRAVGPLHFSRFSDLQRAVPGIVGRFQSRQMRGRACAEIERALKRAAEMTAAAPDSRRLLAGIISATRLTLRGCAPSTELPRIQLGAVMPGQRLGGDLVVEDEGDPAGESRRRSWGAG